MPRFSEILYSLAAGIFIGAAIFEVLPETAAELGALAAGGWMAVGVSLWWFQKRLLKPYKNSANVVPVATALWFHSALEGIITGLAFGISQTFGTLVLAGMVVHLLPEFFAAVALLKGSGAQNRTAAGVTFTGYAILFTSFAITYNLLPQFGNTLQILLAASGGAFLYVGGVSYWRRRSWQTLPWLAVGMLLMFSERFF